MFDRLIESDTSDFKPRRRYFIASSIVVGILFISAVVFSIYASEIGLGNDSFEISAILTPVDSPTDIPEPPEHQPPQLKHREQPSEQPIRIVNMLRPEEQPNEVPPVSTVPNTEMSRPATAFVIGTQNTDPAVPSGQVSAPGPAASDVTAKPAEPIVATKPSPVPKAEPPKTEPPRSLGVVNGMATSLPKPPYPPAALLMNIQGKVDVQITIDEDGKVISAKAVSGPALLKQASERAALRARFRPTTLSNVPTKVTGVIVYNFTKN